MDEINLAKGLSDQEVADRVAQNKTNYVKRTVGKSYLSIVLDNVLTAFNLIGMVVFILMIIAKSWGNTPFYLIILLNTTVGVVQEIRAKHTVQRLSLMTAPTATVIRQGNERNIDVASIVLDDLIKLTSGKQIPADCVVESGFVEANEALLTGESLPIKKNVGDVLLSGSFVVAGTCIAKVIHIGVDNYVEQLSQEAKKYKKPQSELMKSISKIIKIIAVLVFPLGLAVFLTERLGNGFIWQVALTDAGGSMIGMIPSGMVLLTTLTLAVSVIKMSKRHALVQDLYCIEMLARVDVLCLDKTGTITDGTMKVESVDTLVSGYDIGRLVNTVVTATKDSNDTANALKNAYANCKPYEYGKAMPFSSERKFSAVKCSEGNVYIGAPEFVLRSLDLNTKEKLNAYTSKGFRTLAIAIGQGELEDNSDAKVVGLIVLSDNIRPDAIETIKWFKDNEVEIKIISGDNAQTVSVIAGKVGVVNADKYVSLENMTDEQIVECADKYTVFGRVKPDQKALLVKTFKHNGHTVAMTGDGVNDILAMRQADCAVAVACGSEAARSVAHLVLMDNKFASMPNVVKEGRQVVNNIQNASALFLMKTIMTLLTTVFILFIGGKFPFQPKNLYIIEFCVIGLPGFFLALRENNKLIRGEFVANTMWNTLPKGIALAVSVFVVYIFATMLGIKNDYASITTVAMLNMSLAGVIGLGVLSFPFDKWKALVVAASFVTSLAGFFLLDFVFAYLGSSEPFMTDLHTGQILFIVATCILSLVIMLSGELLKKKYKKE